MMFIGTPTSQRQTIIFDLLDPYRCLFVFNTYPLVIGFVGIEILTLYISL